MEPRGTLGKWGGGWHQFCGQGRQEVTGGRGKRQAHDKTGHKCNHSQPFTKDSVVAGSCFWVGMELNLKDKLI